MTAQAEILVDELLEIFEKLVAIYQDLNDLSNAKNKSLVSKDVQPLKEIVQKEQQFIAVIQELEQRRNELQKNIPGEYRSLRQLIEVLDEPAKSRAIDVSGRLTEQIRSLELINCTNSIIAGNMLNFTKHKLNKLLGVSTAPFYGNDAQSTETSRKKGLVDKIV